MATILWENAEGGSDLCVLEETEGGFRLRGTALVVEAGAPGEVRYAVTADRSWQTDGVLLEFESGDVRAPLSLGGAWWGEEKPPQFRRCVDVDLAFTPATNTLAIRRLGLAVGESAEIEVAWVRFPELAVEPARQRYERLARDRYRFTAGKFQADLAVDGLGLVIDYPGLWRVLARG